MLDIKSERITGNEIQVRNEWIQNKRMQSR